MSETTTENTSTTEAVDETSVDTSTEAESATESTDALGDAGKKALDAMKAERKAARDAAAAEKARADALQAKLDGKEAEFQADQEKRAAEAAALAKANDRIRRSEIKAAAKGVLNDPTDAFKYLDLEQFEVGDDGDVDEAAIAAALDDLIKTKPYLAVQDGKRFQGGADGGTRNEASPAQLSEADVKRLYAEKNYDAIEKARTEGRLNLVLGIK